MRREEKKYVKLIASVARDERVVLVGQGRQARRKYEVLP